VLDRTSNPFTPEPHSDNNDRDVGIVDDKNAEAMEASWYGRSNYKRFSG